MNLRHVSESLAEQPAAAVGAIVGAPNGRDAQHPREVQMAPIQRGHIADCRARRFRAGGPREDLRHAGHLQVYDIERDSSHRSARSPRAGEQRVQSDATLLDEGGSH